MHGNRGGLGISKMLGNNLNGAEEGVTYHTANFFSENGKIMKNLGRGEGQARLPHVHIFVHLVRFIHLFSFPCPLDYYCHGERKQKMTTPRHKPGA